MLFCSCLSRFSLYHRFHLVAQLAVRICTSFCYEWQVIGQFLNSTGLNKIWCASKMTGRNKREERRRKQFYFSLFYISLLIGRDTGRHVGQECMGNLRAYVRLNPHIKQAKHGATNHHLHVDRKVWTESSLLCHITFSFNYISYSVGNWGY